MGLPNSPESNIPAPSPFGMRRSRRLCSERLEQMARSRTQGTLEDSRSPRAAVRDLNESWSREVASTVVPYAGGLFNAVTSHAYDRDPFQLSGDSQAAASSQICFHGVLHA